VFFSQSLETCILVEESTVGVSVSVRDLSQNFISTWNLFQCGRAGVSAAIVDSVRAHGGMMDAVEYSRWLTDGSGGPPSTLKAPDEPFDRAACSAALERYLASIR